MLAANHPQAVLHSATICVFEVTIDEPATEFAAVDEMISLDCDVTPGGRGYLRRVMS